MPVRGWQRELGQHSSTIIAGGCDLISPLCCRRRWTVVVVVVVVVVGGGSVVVVVVVVENAVMS